MKWTKRWRKYFEIRLNEYKAWITNCFLTHFHYLVQNFLQFIVVGFEYPNTETICAKILNYFLTQLLFIFKAHKLRFINEWNIPNYSTFVIHHTPVGINEKYNIDMYIFRNSDSLRQTWDNQRNKGSISSVRCNFFFLR